MGASLARKDVATKQEKQHTCSESITRWRSADCLLMTQFVQRASKNFHTMGKLTAHLYYAKHWPQNVAQSKLRVCASAGQKASNQDQQNTQRTWSTVASDSGGRTSTGATASSWRNGSWLWPAHVPHGDLPRSGECGGGDHAHLGGAGDETYNLDYLDGDFALLRGHAWWRRCTSLAGITNRGQGSTLGLAGTNEVGTWTPLLSDLCKAWKDWNRNAETLQSLSGLQPLMFPGKPSDIESCCTSSLAVDGRVTCNSSLIAWRDLATTFSMSSAWMWWSMQFWGERHGSWHQGLLAEGGTGRIRRRLLGGPPMRDMVEGQRKRSPPEQAQEAPPHPERRGSPMGLPSLALRELTQVLTGNELLTFTLLMGSDHGANRRSRRRGAPSRTWRRDGGVYLETSGGPCASSSPRSQQTPYRPRTFWSPFGKGDWPDGDQSPPHCRRTQMLDAPKGIATWSLHRPYGRRPVAYRDTQRVSASHVRSTGISIPSGARQDTDEDWVRT